VTQFSGQADSPDHYAAIWAKTGTGAWLASHGMSSADYQAAFNDNVKKGYRLVSVDGYEVGGQARYAAIWRKASGPAWAARHGMSADNYQAAFNDNVKKGHRLTWVNGYTVQGNALYAAIWDKSAGTAWVARHGMSGAAYQAEFDKNVAKGFHLALVSGYKVGNSTLYAAIWDRSPLGAWAARHGMSATEYQAEFNAYVGQGYRLLEVSGY
jgi:hypothetical protein